MRSGIFRFNGFFVALFGAITRYLNIPVFCSLFIMGRGRKGLIDQSNKKDRKHVFYEQRTFIIIQGDPIGSPADPVFLPAGVIDRLKQMDPKAVARFFSNEQCVNTYWSGSSNRSGIHTQFFV